MWSSLVPRRRRHFRFHLLWIVRIIVFQWITCSVRAVINIRIHIPTRGILRYLAQSIPVLVRFLAGNVLAGIPKSQRRCNPPPAWCFCPSRVL